MKVSFIFLLLIFGSLIFSACSDDSNPVNSSADKQIWPLKTGNTWTYHVISFDSSEAVTGSGDFSLFVSSDTVIANERWYHISNDGREVYHVNRSDGYWVMSNGLQNLVFRYPAKKGDSWNNSGNSIFLQSTDTLISTKLGNYHCYAYRISYNSIPLVVVYLSPGVGLVAEDDYAMTNSGAKYRSFMASLTSLSLK